MNSRGIAARFPVLLGGPPSPARTSRRIWRRSYEGEVRYARDAFEGLRLMDAVAQAEEQRQHDPGRGPAGAAQAAGPTGGAGRGA